MPREARPKISEHFRTGTKKRLVGDNYLQMIHNSVLDIEGVAVRAILVGVLDQCYYIFKNHKIFEYLKFFEIEMLKSFKDFLFFEEKSSKFPKLYLIFEN